MRVRYSMAINDSAVVPLYQQVKDDIRAAIESGKYKTNEKIPPEPELSAEYSVSRITVRSAGMPTSTPMMPAAKPPTSSAIRNSPRSESPLPASAPDTMAEI